MRPVSLSDHQLRIVMLAASGLPLEKRSVFLQRVAALLGQRSNRYTDADIADAAETSLRNLTVVYTAA